jgi:hypothetical protein
VKNSDRDKKELEEITKTQKGSTKGGYRASFARNNEV